MRLHNRVLKFLLIGTILCLLATSIAGCAKKDDTTTNPQPQTEQSANTDNNSGSGDTDIDFFYPEGSMPPEQSASTGEDVNGVTDTAESEESQFDAEMLQELQNMPTEYDLTIKESKTELQSQVYDALNNAGFYVLDVTMLNTELYPNSSCIQGTMGNLMALVVAGDAEEAKTAWMETYNKVLMAGGENNRMVAYRHDPMDDSSPYSASMIYEGKFIRQDLVGDTYVMISGDAETERDYVETLFRTINTYDWETVPTY